jgi:hypothetical protein
MAVPDEGLDDAAMTRPAGRQPAVRREEALWLVEELLPGTSVNNLPLAFRFGDPIDHAALRRAVALLVRRHRALRTVFHADGTRLWREVKSQAVPLVVVEEFAAPIAPETQDARVAAFAGAPFHFDGSPLVRVGLFRDEQGAGDVLCLVFHHLVFDAASNPVVAEELFTLYATIAAGGQPPATLLAEAPACHEVPETERDVAYWHNALDGFDTAAQDLDIHRSAAGAEIGLASEHVSHTLPASATARVTALQRELRAPETVILLAAYYALLARHGAGPDLVVGAHANVRGRDSQRAVGYHVNVLPLRVSADPDVSFRDLVARVRTVFLEAIGHAGLAADDIAAGFPRAAGSWRNAVFRYAFNYIPGMSFDGIRVGATLVEPVWVDVRYGKFDLELFVMPSPAGIQLRAAYLTDALHRDDVIALLRRYEALLDALGAEPDKPIAEVSLWSARDHAVVAAASGTELTAPQELSLGDRLPVVVDESGRELPPGLPGELGLVAPGTERPAVLVDAAERTGRRARRGHDGLIDLLPVPDTATESAAGTESALDDDMLARLIAAWAEFLDGADVGPESNFFASGGQSLTAIQLAQRLSGMTGTKVRLGDVFGNPTPASFARFLADSGVTLLDEPA